MAESPNIQKIIRQAKLLKDGGPLAVLLAELLDKVVGIQGPRGERGELGERGLLGPVGPQGPQGNTGPQGPRGFYGLTGEAGKMGPPGPPGLRGERGDRGYTGQPGPAGSPDKPTEIRDKLQTLRGEERLDASAIKNLPTVTRELPNISLFGVGGGARLGIRDEGIGIGADIRTIDFVGAGVSASKIGENTVVISVPGGVSSINFSDNETPSGVIDGSNITFTLANAPNPASSLRLYLNGQFLSQDVDYTLSGVTITFSSPPEVEFSGLPFRAFYHY